MKQNGNIKVLLTRETCQLCSLNAGEVEQKQSNTLKLNILGNCFLFGIIFSLDVSVDFVCVCVCVCLGTPHAHVCVCVCTCVHTHDLKNKILREREREKNCTVHPPPMQLH